MADSVFKIRGIDRSDLETLFAWRNSERVRANMYSDHIIKKEEHQAWLEKAVTRQDAIYLIFEYHGQPIGFTSYVDINECDGTCFSGAYIGEEQILPGAGVLMSFFCTSYIFEVENMRKVSIEVFAFNKAAITYQKKLGFVQEGYFVKHKLKNGEYQDIVRMALFKDAWLQSKDKIEFLLFRGKKSSIAGFAKSLLE